MAQKGLIKLVLETLCLNAGSSNGKFATAKGKPLAKHALGEPASGDFNYCSVVGMLLSLAGHTCPDITYAVNCAARYTFCPKLVYKHTLKQIGCNLKATSYKGLIMKPYEKLLKIDSCSDANSAGMYGHGTMDDPVCVKGLVGNVINMLLKCWQQAQMSKMLKKDTCVVDTKLFLLLSHVLELVMVTNC